MLKFHPYSILTGDRHNGRFCHILYVKLMLIKVILIFNCNSSALESISKKKGPNYANSNVIPPWQKGDLTIMPRPMNSRPSGFARQKNQRSANGHNFQRPPSRRNRY